MLLSVRYHILPLGTEEPCSFVERHRIFLVARMVMNLPAMQETQVWSLGWENLLEKKMVTLYSILTWRIQWTEEPDGLQKPTRLLCPWHHKQSDMIEWLTLLLFSLFTGVHRKARWDMLLEILYRHFYFLKRWAKCRSRNETLLNL